MNLVLDDSEEVHMKTKNRKPLGKSTPHFSTPCSAFTEVITDPSHDIPCICKIINYTYNNLQDKLRAHIYTMEQCNTSR